MTKILIVDDSAFARNILRMYVENGGHEIVGLAGSGEQALDLFKNLHPDLVILDYLMEDRNGVAVLEDFIRHDSDAKVLVISGTGDHTIEEKVLKAGAAAYVEKPCSQKDLMKLIDQVMGS